MAVTVTPSRAILGKRPSVLAYIIVVFLASFVANLAAAQWMDGSWRSYIIWRVPVFLSFALAVVFTGILALTRAFTGPRWALWTPAMIGVPAGLAIVISVFAGSWPPKEHVWDGSWIILAYISLPPLTAALWFESWETVRLRRAVRAAATGRPYSRHSAEHCARPPDR